MKMRVISCVICVLLSILVIVVEVPEEVNAQPYIQWERIFGGTSDDAAHSMEKTSDGGFIIVGGTHSYGTGGNNGDVWLIKTDFYGNEQWNKTYNKNIFDYGFSGHQTTDGGYIITGVTGTYSGSRDIWLIKTDSFGNKQWDRTFDYKGGDEYGVVRVQPTSDGGYIIVGDTNLLPGGFPDIWLIKTDSYGNKQWDKIFGREGYLLDKVHSVQETSDGGFVIVGTIDILGINDYEVWLIKTDRYGNEQWNRTFGDRAWEEGESVKQTPDGGFVIIGHKPMNKSLGNRDVWLIKTDGYGNEQWNKTYGGSAKDIGFDVQLTSDGGYILSGWTWSYGAGKDDAWLIKTDNSGNEEWNMTFGGIEYDSSQSVLEISENNYIILVNTHSYGPGNYDVWLIRLGPSEPTNQPPVANAGPDQTVSEGDSVQFDASASYDPESTIATYEWDFDSSDGLWWETGAVPDAIGSTPAYMYGDDGVYIATL